MILILFSSILPIHNTMIFRTVILLIETIIRLMLSDDPPIDDTSHYISTIRGSLFNRNQSSIILINDDIFN